MLYQPFRILLILPLLLSFECGNLGVQLVFKGSPFQKAVGFCSINLGVQLVCDQHYQVDQLFRTPQQIRN